MEDVDEDTGSIIEGTTRYARSTPPSPTREQPNTGKTRKDSGRRGRSPPRRHEHHSKDSEKGTKGSPPPRRVAGPSEKDRPTRKPSSSARPSAGRHKPHPPPVTHSGAIPRHSESEYYGVPAYEHQPERLPVRPRAQTSSMPRPPSFHAGEPPRPPPSSFNRSPFGAPHPPPIATSFPAPSWYQGPPGGSPLAVLPPVGPAAAALPPPLRTPMSAQADVYRQKFPPSAVYGHPGVVTRARPHSSMGHRNHLSYDFEQAFSPEEIEGGPPPPTPSVCRRPSISQQRVRRESRDRTTVPPPVRPHSARPANTLQFRPPPPSPPSRSRKLQHFPEEDDSEDGMEYIDAEMAAEEYGIPETRYLPPPPSSRSVVPRSPGRRLSIATDRSSSYHPQLPRPEVGRRRYSGIFPASYGSGVQDDSDYESESDAMNQNIKKFQLYTGAVIPAPPPSGREQRLTHTALRRVSTHGGSSRSTGSSDSMDESEMPSHTTRTTHSGGEDENGGVGLKIRGVRSMRIGGVPLEIDGGEVELHMPRSSEKGTTRDDSSTYREDLRPRYESRPPIPHRSSSRTESFSRSRTVHPQYAGSGLGPPRPASQYGYSPVGQHPELEWPGQPPPQPYGGRNIYHT